MAGVLKHYLRYFVAGLALLVLLGPAVASAQQIVAAQVLRKVTGENLKLPSSGDWRVRFKESDFPRMQKVTDRVYLFQYPHSFPGLVTNSLIVITSDGVVVLDGQGSEKVTQLLVGEVKKLTPQPIKYVVIGSAHGDHQGGNRAFPQGTIFIGHAVLKAWWEMDAKALQANPKAYVYNRNPARLVTINEVIGEVPADPRKPAAPATKVLKVGDTELRISFSGYRGHSGPDLQTYLPRERILWMAESFTSREFPSTGSSAYPREWATMLKQVEQRFGKDVDNVLGAHGFMDSPAVNLEEFTNFRRTLEAVNAEAKRLHDAKVPLFDTPSRWNFGPFISGLFISEYALPAMWKNYMDLEGKLPPCPPCSPDPAEIEAKGFTNHSGPEPFWQWPPTTN